jgi:hypothetical protein
MTPMQEIRAERKRQIEVEGWTTQHDDQHDNGAMLRAAVIYYQHSARKDMPLQMREDGAPIGWPWEAKWWKPKDDRRNLVRAGALCLAERERIRRRHARDKGASILSVNDGYVGHVDQKLSLIIEALSLIKRSGEK